MKDYIEERAIGIANYIIDHSAADREGLWHQQKHGTYGGNKTACLKKILKRHFIWNIE